MTIGWAMLASAACVLVIQMVWKDLKEADKRLESEK